jgi:uncharacterized protein DUF6542
VTTARDDALSSAPSEVGEASAFPGLQGMRWWAVLLLALVLTAGGVAADVLRTGSLGGIFLAAYPGGCVLAILLVQRRDLFVPMVQPPLLLAVSVPVAVAATGSLPASGGLVSTALAVGAPLINGFPAMAVTTVVCVLVGVIRIRVQRWQGSSDQSATRREPVRSGPSGGARGRGDAVQDRPTTKLGRARRESPPADREQAERDRRRAQERARAERDRTERERAQAERDRADRDRADRDRADRERADRERPERDRPERDRPRREPTRPDGGAERRPAAQRSAPVPERGTPEKGPARPAGPGVAGPGAAAGPREPLSREARMREERLREERRDPEPKPPGVHPVRRPNERP